MLHFLTSRNHDHAHILRSLRAWNRPTHHPLLHSAFHQKWVCPFLPRPFSLVYILRNHSQGTDTSECQMMTQQIVWCLDLCTSLVDPRRQSRWSLPVMWQACDTTNEMLMYRHLFTVTHCTMWLKEVNLPLALVCSTGNRGNGSHAPPPHWSDPPSNWRIKKEMIEVLKKILMTFTSYYYQCLLNKEYTLKNAVNVRSPTVPAEVVVTRHSDMVHRRNLLVTDTTLEMREQKKRGYW